MALIKLTIKHLIFDRIFLVLASFVLLFAFIPVFSYFSMRQLQEISITTSLTLNSFILLLMTLFGGTLVMWRDIERKYTYTVLSYPITRTNFILSKFFSLIIILFVITIINFAASIVVIHISASLYKSTLPILWLNIFAAFFMEFLKYTLLLGFIFLFASFSTSFFTPVFSTIAVFIAGNASQGIYDYIMKGSNELSHFSKLAAKLVYYVLPNFSSFDLISYAAYSLPIHIQSIVYTSVYFLLYLGAVLSLSIAVFNKRDFS